VLRYNLHQIKFISIRVLGTVSADYWFGPIVFFCGPFKLVQICLLLSARACGR